MKLQNVQDLFLEGLQYSYDAEQPIQAIPQFLHMGEVPVVGAV